MKRSLLVFLLLGLAGLVASTVLWARPPEVAPEERDELYRRLKVLSEALDVVQRSYVEPVTPEELVYGAVEGIVSRLDPHSSFLTPEMFQEMQVETEGAFGGLGIEVTARDGRLVVVSPIEDTPADRAGIKAGDIIVTIEGETTADMDLADAVKRLRGPKGTQITLQVMREGMEKPLAFTLTRDIIRLRSAKWRLLEDVGVVRITQFQQGTHVEVRKALDAVLEQGDLAGLVLDLRNNPGGLLDQAVKVADLFLRAGTVVSTRGRDSDDEVIYTARDDGEEPDLPIVVLVNGGTASASEIVAGALQDHRRGIVLGERTFGKGSVQTILPLSDGSGLRVTTALYYTPADRSIQAKGIVPDILVGARAETTTASAAPHGQVREENLKGHFEVPAEPAGEPRQETVPDTEGSAEDPQLTRAVEFLRSWRIFRQFGSQEPLPASGGLDGP